MSQKKESTDLVGTPVKPKDKVEKRDDVIKTVKGLAEYIKCSTTKAQAIVNSKILERTKPAIQFYSGGWRFKREELDKYLLQNPDAFRNIKCPH